MNAQKEDIGVLHDHAFDLAFGKDENDFECKIVSNKHCCEKDFFLYYEGTEYGGIVDDIGIDTEADEVTYYGRTWHGILNSKILEPDSGQDYLIVSGEANSVLSSLVSRIGLSSLFSASTESSGINIENYQFNRYISGYDGIKKMLAAFGAKLNIAFENGFVVLSAKPIIDYSKDDQFETDQISFKIKKSGNNLNHVICLGKGDLKEREVIHVYADKNGEISEIQSLTGLLEVCATYDNANASSTEELKKGGIEMIQKAWASDELDFDFDPDNDSYDIGDIVGAFERMTSTKVSAEIIKKIVKFSNGTLTVSYECDKNIATASDDSTTSLLGKAIIGKMILGNGGD